LFILSSALKVTFFVKVYCFLAVFSLGLLNATSLPYVKCVIETYGSTCTIHLFGYIIEIVSGKGHSFLVKTSCRYVTLGTGAFYGLNYLDERIGLSSAANFKLSQITSGDYSGVYVPPTPEPLFPLHLEATALRAESVLYHFAGITSDTKDLEDRVHTLEGLLDVNNPKGDLDTRISNLENKKIKK